MRPTPTRIDALQALRALAAILVMLFHLGGFLPQFLGEEFAGNAFAHGEAGVDIFFVISGFIIYYSVKARSEMGRRRFLEARFLRLYPIYWLVMIALIAAEATGVSSGNPGRMDPATIFRSMLLLASPEYILVVAWSLVIEVMFYLVFAMSFFRSERAFFAAMGLWSSLAVVARLTGYSQGPFWLTDYVLYSGVSEFLMGALIARYAASAKASWGRAGLVLGALGLGLSMSQLGPGLAVGREVAYGIPSALLVFGAVVAAPRVPRWLTEIGEASYVLYLVHLTTLSVVLRVLRRVDLAGVIGVELTAWFAASATVVVAYTIHRWLERPLLAWARARLAAVRG